MFGWLRRGLRTPFQRKFILVEAFLSTATAWATVRLVPYAIWRPKLGNAVPLAAMQLTGAPARGSGNEVLEDIAWAHALLARRFSRRFTCLMLALSAKAMLRRRQLPSMLVLGAGRRQDGAVTHLGAHAWVLSDGFEIVGGDSRDGHAPVAVYCSWVSQTQTGDPGLSGAPRS